MLSCRSGQSVIIILPLRPQRRHGSLPLLNAPGNRRAAGDALDLALQRLLIGRQQSSGDHDPATRLTADVIVHQEALRVQFDLDAEALARGIPLSGTRLISAQDPSLLCAEEVA